MKKTVYLLIAFFFIQGIVHNLGHPVTPAFVRGLGIPDFMFGVFFAAMSFGLMIGSPIWGILADQGRRKFYIVLGLSIYSIGQFLFAYSADATLMVIFRFVAGFGVGSALTIMTSQIIEQSELRDRAKHLAYAAASSTLGASLGYWIGGFLSTNASIVNLIGTSDYRRIFVIQVILNVLYTISIVVLLRNQEKVSKTMTKPSMIAGLKEISKIDKSLLIFLISLTFMTIGSINVSKYLDVYFDQLGYNPQQLGTFVMVTGIVSMLSSIFLVPYFAKVKKQLKLIGIIHLICAAIIFYVFRASNFLLIMYTVFMIYVVLKTIYQPLEQSYIANHATNNKYGSIMGLRQSFVSV
ncbi:MAG: MFS transporter, partial [Acholeplasmataceae bacterium]|nr:MFS transporter [Acholeplasmataceae bacterium]